MSGLVAIEEAFQIPELRHEAKNHAPGAAAETLAANLVDITQQRLQKMDAHNIDKMVLSLTSPGPQGRSSATEAAALACKANNYLSSECRKYASRFAGFCALSMHSPDEACTELRRNMKDLGMVGAMINDFQDLPNGQSGYYDGPEWDEFWSEVETLDAIIYFHPRFPHPDVRAQMYGGRPGIVGAAWSFAVGVGTLLLGLCTNGVFDRHPKAKVVVGHMGEHVVTDIVRLDSWLQKNGAMKGMKMEQTVKYYLQRNIWITTSGNFNTRALRHVVEEIGADRVIFSIDYPYDSIEDAVQWWNTVKPEDVGGKSQLNQIARGNAIHLLKLS